MKTIIVALKSFGMRVKRIKEILEIPKSSIYEKLKERTNRDYTLIKEIQKIAYGFPFYGYRRIYMALRKEGFTVNHKKVYRIYKYLNLERKNKKKKKLTLSHLLFLQNLQLIGMKYGQWISSMILYQLEKE